VAAAVVVALLTREFAADAAAQELCAAAAAARGAAASVLPFDGHGGGGGGGGGGLVPVWCEAFEPRGWLATVLKDATGGGGGGGGGRRRGDALRLPVGWEARGGGGLPVAVRDELVERVFGLVTAADAE
jgi:hypothetical protein